VSKRLFHSRKFSVFSSRLEDMVAGSGGFAGEFGEKAADRSGWQDKTRSGMCRSI
jgi:hypothetical protein